MDYKICVMMNLKYTLIRSFNIKIHKSVGRKGLRNINGKYNETKDLIVALTKILSISYQNIDI